MRVAVIGLGDIAQKAYLPIITARSDLELTFCTRNQATLQRLSQMYRVTSAATTIQELLDRGIDAAFVHTATESHVEIAETLLRHQIDVYVDKPIAYSFAQAQRLVEVAEQTERLLMVGFNRRFAPMYASLRAVEQRRCILLQKNRAPQPDYARRFIFDDFIHVVDTLRYLAPSPIRDLRVSSFQQDGQLHHVLLHCAGDDWTGVGLMNRASGATEETLELMSPGHKWLVRGLNTTVHLANGAEQIQSFNDWEPILHRRGFPQIIDHFLECVRGNSAPLISAQDALETHRLCEQIVREVEQTGAAVWTPPAAA